MTGSLTTAQCAAYGRDGYLCPLDMLTPAQAAAHRAALEDLERGQTALPHPIGRYLRMNAHITTDLALQTARTPQILDAVSALGLDRDQLEARVDDPAMSAALTRNAEAAVAAGAFGVPCFVWRGKMFFGNDRLPLLRHHIARHS